MTEDILGVCDEFLIIPKSEGGCSEYGPRMAPSAASGIT